MILRACLHDLYGNKCVANSSLTYWIGLVALHNSLKSWMFSDLPIAKLCCRPEGFVLGISVVECNVIKYLGLCSAHSRYLLRGDLCAGLYNLKCRYERIFSTN